MASSKSTYTVQWSGSASKTVSAATIQWSDAITLNDEDWAGSLQVSADNAGTPASGDTCNVYIAWSNGDLLGDTGNDYDTDEHGEFVMQLDTYSSNTPGEDPARRTVPIEIAGKVAMKVGVICAQAATRNIVVRALIIAHRAQ